MAGRPAIKLDIEEIERLAGIGLTDEEICYAVGVSHQTFYKNKRNSAVFAEAIKRGKATAKSRIGKRIFEKAEAGDTTALIWVEKSRYGYTDKQDIEIRLESEVDEVLNAGKDVLRPDEYQRLLAAIAERRRTPGR